MENSKDSIEEELLKLKDSLLCFAYKLTSDSEKAKDLLQDTALKVLTNRDKYVSQENFKGWVFTIMKNIFLNNIKKESRISSPAEQTDDVYLLNIPQECGFNTPDSSYSLKEINKVISLLSKEYRYPLLMLVVGYKYQDISHTMNIPTGTVKSRIYYARKKLQVLLKDYLDDL